MNDNKKQTWGYLLDTGVSLKNDDFNTPFEFPILKKGNGGFDCYFKTASCPHFDHKTSSAATAFFYYPRIAFLCKLHYFCSMDSVFSISKSPFVMIMNHLNPITQMFFDFISSQYLF
ncbi:TPA: hypothetical protein ACX96Z_000085 [Clostridium sporogenes]